MTLVREAVAPTTAATTAATTTVTAADALATFHGPRPEALSRADFTNLVVLLRHARQGAWAFALYNNAATRETVVRALKTLLAPLPVYEWTYSPEKPFPLTYLERLTAEQRRERAVVFFFDFERAGDDVWKSLDYNRELYADQPHGLVFWISPPMRGVAARKAPHFWAQRSGVFDFIVTQAAPALETQWTASRDIAIENVDEIQRQLRLYQGLLDELAPLPTTPPAYLANLHYKVARLTYHLDRLSESKANAVAALTYAELSDDQLTVADVLQALGDLEVREANLQVARDRYLAALAIYPAIGARLGEANVLQSIGNLKLAEGDPSGAFEEYRHALEIQADIGNQLGVGACLGYMGRASAAADAHHQAVLLFEQAISLYQTIVERFSQAIVLDWQAQAFLKVEEQAAALGAWWQARTLAHAIGLPLAQRLDQLFAGFAQQMGEEPWRQLAADLATHAEEWRQAGVAAVQQTLASEA